MAIQRLYLCLLVTLLSSCAVVQESGDLVLTKKVQSSSTLDLQSEELKNLPPAQVRPTIAIYPNSFRDLTGQRRSNSTFALFSTGEVLMETLVSKSILSTSVSQDVFRFIETGTELVEIEGGISENESVSIALQKAVETGVLNIINIGIERGYWKYENFKINEPNCTDECVSAIRG
jgi:hypothetical protein